MSSFCSTQKEHAWIDPSPSNIYNPTLDEQQEMRLYNAHLELEHQSQEAMKDYMSSGFTPSSFTHPGVSSTLTWQPASGIALSEGFGGENAVTPSYYASNFETTMYTGQSIKLGSATSPSSDSSSNANHLKTLASAHMPLSSPEVSTLRLRKRGKELNDLESELMKQDDSLLTEEQLTIKRKAQNRLAQRAFRERKEIRLKELEEKLLKSEGERQRLFEALDEIRLQFHSVQTENQALRSNRSSVFGGTQALSSRFSFPQSQEAFVQQMLGEKTHHTIIAETVDKIYDEPEHPGQKVLAVGAVWDYLLVKIEEEEYEDIDMAEVMQALKGNEMCHGYGPAYSLAVVNAALQSVADKQNQ